MIGQYLSNTNENATVFIFQKFSELNKALVGVCSLLQVAMPKLRHAQAHVWLLTNAMFSSLQKLKTF